MEYRYASAIMSVMEFLNRIIVGLTILIFFSLGVKMGLRKAGRGHITSMKDANILRTILLTLLALLTTWYVALPNTIPQKFQINIPHWMEWIGFIVFITGISIRILAQKTLGSQWSADISLASKHHLVTTGPYAWVRHPMYASYFLIALGLSLITENWLIASVAFAYDLISLARIDKEEILLRSYFEHHHEQYVHDVPGKIFPRRRGITKKP